MLATKIITTILNAICIAVDITLLAFRIKSFMATRKMTATGIMIAIIATFGLTISVYGIVSAWA